MQGREAVNVGGAPTEYIGSTSTFLYFHLYLYTVYAAHYVYFTENFSELATIFIEEWFVSKSW